MAYAKVAAQLVIDNAHADGLITALGIGRDWEALEPRDESRAGFTPDAGGQYVWELGPQSYNPLGAQCEYIKSMRVIAPHGTGILTDMDITAWTIARGKWMEIWTANPGIQMLYFYDGRTDLTDSDEDGIINTNDGYTPNFQFFNWRFPPDPEETDPAFLGLFFEGDGVAPQYCLGFPAFPKTESVEFAEDWTSEPWKLSWALTQPYLMGKPRGEANWTLIDKIGGGGYAPQGSESDASKARSQGFRVEQLNKTLIVRSGDWSDPWTFSGKWWSREGREVDFELTEGRLGVHVTGHTMMFALAQLSYPSSVVLYPRKYFFVPPNYNQTPSYRFIGSAPAGTDVTVTTDLRTSGHTAYTRPKITFESDDNKDRAALYCVQEYRRATIGGAVSNPVTTQGSAPLKLMSAHGRMDDTWQGAELTAELEAKQGSTLFKVLPNAKVQVQISTDDGVTSYTHFTGYTLGPERLAPSGVIAATATLHARDMVEARLSHKVMDEHCSYEGWPENVAVAHILNRAGVPDALGNVDASLTDPLPVATAGGTRKLKFRPDIDVPSALKTIAEIRNRRWGVDSSGTVFWGKQQVHTPGHYDWTLDADTTTLEHVAESIHSSRSIADFANWLKVLVGEGLDAAAKVLMDEDSLSDSTARNFIADIWYRIEMRPDGDDANALAEALWPQVHELSDIIRWRMWDEPWLLPEHYIRVQATDADIPTNDIYCIIAKSWSVEKNGRYNQELEAKLIEEA